MSSPRFSVGLSTQIAGMCLAIILTFCLSFAWLYAQSSKRQYGDRRLKVLNQVETAYGVLEYFAAAAGRGELTQAEAQDRAKAAIKGLRYGAEDYFWINDTQPAMIMHPFKPELDGKDLSQSADPNGKKLFVEFVDVCRKEGGGYVDYFWPKPGFDEPVAKISYVKLFPQWNWIIGNGLYIDDVEASLAHVLKTTIGLLGAVVLVTALLVIGMSRSLTGALRSFMAALGKLAQGDTGIAVHGSVCREIDSLGLAMRRLAEIMNARSEVALGIADGDLTHRVELLSERDLLGQSMARMHGNLSDILCQVQATSMQIAADAGQISAGSSALADGATRQAAALEEISSSMQDIASQTGQNAENARQANALAAQGLDFAGKGNEEMEGMMAAMGEISSAAENISRIIKVIDEIAFQTNLLALNAAVEAARAGQHGKGFAVVAEEVRNLAGRSAKAAKETEELIASSVAKTERGLVIADRTAASLKEIVTVSAKVSDLIQEIAAASNEQAQAIQQINQGLAQIDQVNQQATANTEESAASASVLADHARQLQALLQRFRVDQRRCTAQGPAPARNSRPAIPTARPTAARGAAGEAAVPRIALDDGEFGKY